MSFDSVVDTFRYPVGGSVGAAFAGAEVATPEIVFVEVDVAGTAVCTGCVLGAASASLAEDEPALSISSLGPVVAASVADDTVSLLDVSLLVACVAGLSAVPAAVAVAVFRASLVIESLVLDARVLLDVTADVASPPELSVRVALVL